MSLAWAIISGILCISNAKSPECDTTIKPEPSDEIIYQAIENLDLDTLAEPGKIQIEDQKMDGNLIRAHFYIGKRKKKIRHGLYEVYTEAFPAGKLIESGFYKQGNREGKWKRWDLSGKLTSESDYRNNKFNGYIILYRKNGIVAEKTKMKDGKFDCLDGFSEGFYENGTKKFIYQVKDGIEIKNEKYDSLGKSIGHAE
jgi:antitoxin component YwqK of YwqJK toxin-antitoxin module